MCLIKDEGIISPFSTGGTSTSQTINDMSSIALRVSRSLLDNSPPTSIEDLHAPNEYCPFGEEEEVIQCDSNQLRRSYDGTCNNLQFGWWGKSETPFKRILAPSYDDGLNVPRKRSVMGGKKNTNLIFLNQLT